ncbi:tetratricopeptide repeat protein [Spirillospora sp. NPDC048911]|uniref:tetratricopeptide repeat protein n=1 Tax=Spirillospora sp. NPDC048911 TaxID=3364527 RepID=UPI00371633DF
MHEGRVLGGRYRLETHPGITVVHDIDEDDGLLYLPLADHAARERGRLLGVDHPDTLTARHLVGLALYQLDREMEAVPVIQAVAHARSRVLGQRHADTLDSRHLLATTLYMLGRYAEALPIAAGVTADRQLTLGPEAPATLESRSTLAWTLHMLDRNDEALAAVYDLAATQARVLGNDHARAHRRGDRPGADTAGGLPKPSTPQTPLIVLHP